MAKNPKKAPAELSIEYWDLEKLKRHPRNPKAHNTDAITSSFERFGYKMPIAIDERSGRICAGHGRADTLEKLKAAGEPAPEGIRVDGESWLIPVVRGMSFRNAAEAEAYLIADNKISEVGGWESKLLLDSLDRAALTDQGLAGLGFDDKALDALRLEVYPPSPVDPGEDEVPEVKAVAKSSRGELWLLDKHRVLCGDATSRKDVKRLFGKAGAGLMVTDPPYGVGYNPDWRNDAAKAGNSSFLSKNRRNGLVSNDDRVDWLEAWRLFTGSVAYVWHASLHTAEAFSSLTAAGFNIRNQIIWAKQHFVISRGHYHWKHEPCWYAVRDGSTADWEGDRKQTTLWEVQNLGAFGGGNEVAGGGEEGRTNHGTQKPVELMRRPIINHTKVGEAVYDPFLGSGSTLIAAETTGRICFALDIDPIYIDATIQRWQTFTGKTAVRDRDGREFNSL